MATTVVLNLTVNGVEDIERLKKELGAVEKEFENVRKESAKADSELQKVGENGGAIAILDELTGGLASRVRDAAEATKVFNLQLKATRTALLATGIGALVIGLAAIVAYWDDIKIAVTGINEDLEEQKTLQQTTLGLLEAQLAIVDKKIEQAEAEGKATDELRQQQTAITQRLFEQNQLRQQIIKAQIAEVEATSTQLNLNTALAGVLGFLKNGFEGVAQASVELGRQQVARLEELRTQLAETELKALDLQFALTGQPVSGEETTERPTVSPLESFIEAEGIKTQTLRDGEEERVRIAQEAADKLNQITKTRADAELITEQILSQQKLGLLQQTLGAVTQIIGQNTAAGKAAAIASALINTYQGVTQVWKNETTLPEPFGTAQKVVSTATVLASGLRAVQQIRSTQIPNFGGGGGIGGGGSIPTPSVPSFNVVGNTGINQIGQALNGQADTATRAYVVFGDIEKASQIENEAVQGATL